MYESYAYKLVNDNSHSSPDLVAIYPLPENYQIITRQFTSMSNVYVPVLGRN